MRIGRSQGRGLFLQLLVMRREGTLRFVQFDHQFGRMDVGISHRGDLLMQPLVVCLQSLDN